jgi:predicted O-methyltransferase YrrM
MLWEEAKEYARLSPEDWDMLSAIPYGNYVEVGTFHGASASAASIKADKVTTIDIYDHQPKVYETIWPHAAKKINFFKGTSKDYADILDATTTEPSIDVLFIDGAHEYQYLTYDCRNLIRHVKKGGTVLFHDCNPDNKVTRVHECVHHFLATINHKKFDKIAGTTHMLQIEIT